MKIIANIYSPQIGAVSYLLKHNIAYANKVFFINLVMSREGKLNHAKL